MIVSVRLLFVVVLLAINGVIGLAVQPAIAEVYTCGKTSIYNWHDGYLQAYGTGSYEGANATIATNYGAVCDTNTSPNNFTNAYAMIAGGNGKGWAQSGYIRWYNHCAVRFAQISNGGSSLATRYGTDCLTYGQSHTYQEEYNQSCQCEHSKIDGTDYETSTFNPYADWTSPFSPQFQGEALYRESDMPGNASSPTNYTSLQAQKISDDSWVNYSCNTLTYENDGTGVRSDGEKWFDLITTCPSFKIYIDTAP